jgi:hypothetical protein
MILRKMKELAERYLGKEVSKARLQRYGSRRHKLEDSDTETESLSAILVRQSRSDSHFLVVDVTFG